jgi:flagellar basal-body rod protein FlgG
MGNQQARLDVVTNNLAHVESKGYKREQVVNSTFANMLISMQSPYKKGLASVGTSGMGTAVATVSIDTNQGRLNETGEYTDLALVGDGFYVFQVQTAAGTKELYSRDSSFHVDSDGFLVNSRGDRLLSESGPIEVKDQKFSVTLDGKLQVEGGAEYQLQVVEFGNIQALKKEGEKYFLPTAGAQIRDAEATEIRQGLIEESNVDVTDEMTNMIQALRSYQAGQKLMQAHDEMLDKAINQVGTLR